MNFLSHAWILPEKTPDALLGCLLPDLLGGFDRRARRVSAETARAVADMGHGELASGLLAHHEADACFHALDAFRAGCAALRPLGQRLNEAGASVRPFFFAHILLEMLLDEVVVERQSGFATAFHDALARSSVKEGVAALGELSGDGFDVRGFERFVRGFIERRGLERRGAPALVARLSHVLGRARQSLGDAEGLLARELDEARILVSGKAGELLDGPRVAVARSRA